jgi:hypothetical protein
MTEELFGPLVSTWTIQQQVVGIYRTWCPEYLAAIERQEHLQREILIRPRTPQSYHGGLDFLSWEAAELPKVIVVVEPTGQPERAASLDEGQNVHGQREGRGGYTQTYEIQVGCVTRGVGASTLAAPSPEPEDEVRALAAYYGAMSMLLVDQVPALVNDIWMVESPRLSFPNPDDRTICLSTTGFHATVAPIKLLSAGPVGPVPKESPYFEAPEEPWQQEPTVSSHKTTVVGTEI